jgi:DNA-binding NtrC family response regulator
VNWLTRTLGGFRRRLPRSEQNHRNRISILGLLAAERDRLELQRIASHEHWSLKLCTTVENAIRLLQPDEPALILCDREIAGLEWQDAIQTLASSGPGSCVILASPVNDEYLWREVIGCGGYDVITIPFEKEATVHTIQLAWSYWKATKSRPYALRRG